MPVMFRYIIWFDMVLKTMEEKKGLSMGGKKGVSEQALKGGVAQEREQHLLKKEIQIYLMSGLGIQ
jgi:hypothetical protein